jgi:hypothetical protein
MDYLNHCCLPFAKVLALGYYDGPTEGLLLCRSGLHGFRFEMLDADTAMDVRIFSLAPIDPNAITRLSDALAKYQELRWPVWVPRWKFPTEEDRSTLEDLVDQILAEAGSPEWVIATTDISGEPTAFRRITPEEIERVDNWFTVLGLVAHPDRIGKFEGMNQALGKE